MMELHASGKGWERAGKACLWFRPGRPGGSRISLALLVGLLCLLPAAAALAGNGAPRATANEPLARWHINYANYLIDVGKYMEALENYDAAGDLSAVGKTRGDALLGKAHLLSNFLDAPDKALQVYDEIRQQHPDRAQIAIYRKALLLMNLDRVAAARKLLHQYLDQFPAGRFRVPAEALLRSLAHPQPKKPTEIIGIPELRVKLFGRTAKVVLGGQAPESPVCAMTLGCRAKVEVTAGGGRLLVNRKQTERSRMCFYSIRPLEVAARGRSKRVRGAIEVVARGSSLMVLNLINIEDYLLSVVPAESLPSWPLEALKAQAVAARTYAFYQMLHRTSRNYDLVATEGDQMYGGTVVEQVRTTRAVRATQGLIVIRRGLPILAMYTANSGGYTADAGAVFDLPKPYLVAHRDPWSLKGKMAHWTRRFQLGDIRRALRRIGVRADGLRDIRVARKGPSGRVLRVRFVFAKDSRIMRTRTSLGRALKLPEILFEIERRGDRFTFKGRGFGHGVGYSQWGSAIMAKERDFRQILSFYYPSTQVAKKW